MICLITGGQRSGKSSYAQELALSLSDAPVYVATARVWDEEFKKRIARHKSDRGEEWTTFEAEKELSALDLEGRVAVIDCLTLWLTNFFTDTGQDVEKSLHQVKKELKALTRQETTLIFVTNELGMGMHATTGSGRKFADLQGWMNQHVAGMADRVILMVSGIPFTIKEEG